MVHESSSESSMTKTDNQLKQDIEQELRWDPRVNATQIGVTVDSGAVCIFGTVDTYAEKWAAEAATKRVSGVRTVAEDLTVKILEEHVRSDSDLAIAIQTALTWNVAVPKSVTALVRKGYVVLEGEVTGNYQRKAAEDVVRLLTGVVGVTNAITLKPDCVATTAEVKESVRAALQRQATFDANSIQVESVNGKVTLSGHASNWRSIEDATDAAWASPGVSMVVDNVTVSPSLS